MTEDYEKGSFCFSDGYRAFYRYWPGSRGAILYLHGIQSHGLWFERSARHLASAGYAVMVPDRRGSGRNTRARGDVTSYRRWLADLAEMSQYLADQTGHQRVHLVGVSWGGKLAGAFARYLPTRPASMTLVAPGIYPAVDLPGATKLHIALAAVARSSRPFPIPLNDPSLFTANVEWQRFISSDIRRLTWVTARFFWHSCLLDRPVRKCDRRFPFPVRLVLAEHDRIIDNCRTLELFRSWRAVAKRLTYYHNASHTLEFEPDPGEYFSDLVEWIDHVNR